MVTVYAGVVLTYTFGIYVFLTTHYMFINHSKPMVSVVVRRFLRLICCNGPPKGSRKLCEPASHFCVRRAHVCQNRVRSLAPLVTHPLNEKTQFIIRASLAELWLQPEIAPLRHRQTVNLTRTRRTPLIIMSKYDVTGNKYE